jgi:hypothetical protein
MMEATMQSRTLAVSGLSLAMVLGSYALAGQAAEKRELTYVKTYSKSISKSSFMIEDVPNHEVMQEILLQQSRYSGTDFKPVEEWIHIHTDQADGSGSHKGYFFIVLEGGDQTYGTFDGRHKTLTQADGAWSSTWEGSYRYLGGTGKYKHIKGAGTYKGRASPKEPFYEEGRETIEY